MFSLLFADTTGEYRQGNRRGSPARRGTVTVLLVIAAVLAGLAATATAGLSGADRTSLAVQPLKACGFLVSNAGGAPSENIKLLDAAAPNARATVVLEQTGVD